MADPESLVPVAVATPGMADIHARIITLHNLLLSAQFKAHETDKGGRDAFRAQLKESLASYQKDWQQLITLERRARLRIARRAQALPATPAASPAAPLPPNAVIAPQPPLEERPITHTPAAPAPSPTTATGTTRTDVIEGTRAELDDDDGGTDGIDAIKTATELGIEPETPAKWKDKKLGQLLQKYLAKAQRHAALIASHNPFLRADAHARADFERFVGEHLDAIRQYVDVKGEGMTQERFRNVVRAIARLQQLFEQHLEDSITVLRSEQAAALVPTASDVPPGKNLTTAKNIERMIAELEHRHQQYETFVRFLTSGKYAEALADLDLHVASRNLGVTLKNDNIIGDLTSGQRAIIDAAFRRAQDAIVAWSSAWHGRDEQEMLSYPQYHFTLLTLNVALQLLEMPGRSIKEIVQNVNKTLNHQVSAETVAQLVHYLLIARPEDIETLVPPVISPSPDVVATTGALTDIAQEIPQAAQGAFTREMASAMLNTYRKILGKGLLTRYLYSGKSRKERDEQQRAAYGDALDELATLAAAWTSDAPERAIAAVRRINTSLRNDLTRVRAAIEGALEVARAADKRKDLASHAKWTGAFQGQITQIEQAIDVALRAIAQAEKPKGGNT